MPVKRQIRPWMIPLFLLVFALPVYWPHHSTKPEVLPEVYFYDKSDRPVTLDAFKGKVVLVNLWASWCVPCVVELPSLGRLQRRLPAKKFQVVAISQDRLSAGEIRKFMDENGGRSLEFYYDRDRQTSRKWDYDGLPTSYLLDREGRIVMQYDGAYDWDQEDMVQDVKALLR